MQAVLAGAHGLAARPKPAAARPPCGFALPPAPLRQPRRSGIGSGGRVACSSGGGRQRQEAGRRAPLPSALDEAPPLAARRGPPEQPPEQEQQPEHAATRWMPASWLSGWKGKGSLLLSLGAVTGGGLLGSGFDLSGPGSMLQALGVLGLTVGIHEAGHFYAAVSRGIHVTKFSIGFGPTLLKWQGGEVEYSLRALPLGGFVAFPDDDPESPYPADDPDLLRNRPVGDRAAVITAGVAANMAMAAAICLLQAGTVGVPEPVYKPGVRLGELREASVAARAGLRQGDVVLRVGDLEVAPRPGAVNAVVDKIKASPERELLLLVEREGERLSVPVTPALSADGTGRIGIQLAANADILRKKGDNPVQTLALAAEEYVTLTGTVLKGLYQFATNFSSTVDSVSGPVAILAAGAEVARSNTPGLYQFAALININLAVVNILPLPALDGGALALLGAEVATGGPLDRDLEDLIAAFGSALLVLLGIWLLTHDLTTLGGHLLGLPPAPPGAAATTPLP